jgi:response regulator RpfG family c-di-GMP phosphodiesterase
MVIDKIKILYVDDEENNLFSFKATFRIKYEVLTATSAQKAIEILNDTPGIAIIVTDQRMPNMTGVEFLGAILDDHPDPMRILITGYTDINALIEAVNKGKIFHYLNKPWDEEELVQTIERAHEVYKNKMQEKSYKEALMRTSDQMEFLLRQKLLD